MKNFRKLQLTAWIIWITAAIFYAYEFFIRISPSVMVPELMHAFTVDAALLGSLSAFYYYAYASMQIPVGILFDRYGVRRLLAAAAMMVTIGSILFAMTTQLWVADLGRVIMGAGSAFSFVGCLKLASNWFTARRFPIVVGLTNMLGVFGAIVAETPLALFVDHVGWRESMLIIGIIGAFIALLISLIVRDAPTPVASDELHLQPLSQQYKQTLLKGLWHVLQCKRTWYAAIYGGLMVAPISAFAELWANPFLKAFAGMPRVEAAGASTFIYIGIAVGAPVLGWLSGLIGKRKPLMRMGTIGALAALLLILLVPIKSFAIVATLMFCFGFFTSSMLLIFAINTETNPKWANGVTIAFTNMIIMLGGTIFQPLVGYLIDLETKTNTASYPLQISAADYQHALLVLPLCQVVAFFVLFMIKETYCRQTCQDECHAK